MREKREQKRKNIFEITVKNSTKLQIQESQITSMINACFPGGSAVKNLPANAGDVGSVPGLGRFPGEGNGNLL